MARRLVKKLPFLRHKPTRHPYSLYPMSVDDTRVYDAVFIIDDSGSIPLDDFKKGLEALRKMIERAQLENPGSKFAAIKFSDQAKLLFNFVSPGQAKRKLLKVARSAGMTNTQDALKMARRDLFLNPATSGHRHFASRLAMVVTDGQSNIQSDQTVVQASELKKIGTEVLVLAVGNFGASGRKEINSIASYPPQENVFNLDNYGDMLAVVKMAVKISK